jgi:hypothetical protein
MNETTSMNQESSFDTRPYDFYHATNARRQGIGTIVFVSLFMLVFGGILYLFDTQLEMKIEGEWLYAMAGIVGLVYLSFLVYASILIIKGGQWIFAVRDGVLCVRSPTKAVGATFTIFVADIVSITEERIGSGEHGTVRLYVVSKDGTKYEITQNSGLNWLILFEKLRKLNPAIRKEYTTPSDILNAFRSRFSKRERNTISTKGQ